MIRYEIRFTPEEVANRLKKTLGTTGSTEEIVGIVDEHSFVVHVRPRKRHPPIWKMHGTILARNALTQVTADFRINPLAVVCCLFALPGFLIVFGAILATSLSGKDRIGSSIELAFVVACLLLAVYQMRSYGKMERVKLSALLEQLFGLGDSTGFSKYDQS